MLSVSLNKTFCLPSFNLILFNFLFFLTGNNYTSCKQHKSEMTAVKNDYIPGCTLDGYYEKIQCECKKLKSSLDCSGYLDTTCWCSDKYGTTIPGAISSGAFADCKTGKYIIRRQKRNMLERFSCSMQDIHLLHSFEYITHL